LQAEEIGLAFDVAGKLKESHGDKKIRSLVGSVSGPAIRNENHRGDRSELNDVALGSLFGAVTGGNVRNFVGHDAGQLGFFLRAQDQAAVDVEKASGKRECVDFIGVDHFDGEGNFCIGVADQVLPHAVHVFSDDRVIDQFGRAFDFLRESFAEGNFLFE